MDAVGAQFTRDALVACNLHIQIGNHHVQAMRFLDRQQTVQGGFIAALGLVFVVVHGHAGAHIKDFLAKQTSVGGGIAQTNDLPDFRRAAQAATHAQARLG